MSGAAGGAGGPRREPRQPPSVQREARRRAGAPGRRLRTARRIDFGRERGCLGNQEPPAGTRRREWRPRPLAEDEADEPGDWVVYRNVAPEFERSCSDAAIAALVLARLRYPEARPVIESLLLEAPEGEERAALAEAASLYRSTR